MDKLSFRILKFIKKSKTEISRDTVIESFGESARDVLTSLERDGYIASGRIPIGCGPGYKPVLGSNGLFRITRKGVDFVESRPSLAFDRWLTRLIAIWGAITGTVALALELLQMFR